MTNWIVIIIFFILFQQIIVLSSVIYCYNICFLKKKHLITKSMWNYSMSCQIVEWKSHDFMEWIIWKHFEKIKNRISKMYEYLYQLVLYWAPPQLSTSVYLSILRTMKRFAWQCNTHLIRNGPSFFDLCCSFNLNFDLTGGTHPFTWKKFINWLPVVIGILMEVDDV